MQIWLDGGNDENSSLTLTPDHLVLTGPCHYSDEEGRSSFALKQAVKVCMMCMYACMYVLIYVGYMLYILYLIYIYVCIILHECSVCIYICILYT